MALRSAALRMHLLSLDLRLAATHADNTAIACLLSSQGPQEQLLSLRALLQFPAHSSSSSKVTLTGPHALVAHCPCLQLHGTVGVLLDKSCIARCMQAGAKDDEARKSCTAQTLPPSGAGTPDGRPRRRLLARKAAGMARDVSSGSRCGTSTMDAAALPKAARSHSMRSRHGQQAVTSAEGASPLPQASKPHDEAAAGETANEQPAKKPSRWEKRLRSMAALLFGHGGEGATPDQAHQLNAPRAAADGAVAVKGKPPPRSRQDNISSSSIKGPEKGPTVKLPSYEAINTLAKQRQAGTLPRMGLSRDDGMKVAAHLRSFTYSSKMKDDALALYINFRVGPSCRRRSWEEQPF